jgi:phosphoribosylaminoimidazole-succinocarboxamide synthase
VTAAPDAVDLPLLSSGKVREIYDAGGGELLLVASDRISAFDVVMAERVPDKGRVLTAMSAFWFEELADVCGNHLVSTDVARFPEPAQRGELAGRATLCRRAEMLPIECIVRGHLSGSAWAEYEVDGTVHGMPAPAGLRRSERLPEPLFTPSIKAESGHDENITVERAAELVGRSVVDRAAEICLELYRRGAERAAAAGIVVADTKFELGFADGELILCDEVLTPDSSRFWPADGWEPGCTPPSFDKQPLRDFLSGLGWDKRPPPPPLPPAVVAATSERYTTAYERVTGRSLVDWPGA